MRVDRKHLLPTLCGGALLFVALHVAIPVGAASLFSCAGHEVTPPSTKVNYIKDPAGCLWIVAPNGDLLPVRKDGLGTPQVCVDEENKERPKPLLAD